MWFDYRLEDVFIFCVYLQWPAVIPESTMDHMFLQGTPIPKIMVQG